MPPSCILLWGSPILYITECCLLKASLKRQKDNIYLLQLQEKPAQISLACYCSVYTHNGKLMKWTLGKLQTITLQRNVLIMIMNVIQRIPHISLH